MNKITEKFLKSCTKHHIDAVVIGIRHPLVGRSLDFCFGPSASVFAEGEAPNGFPAIWYACADAGVGCGAGNGGQHQIKHDCGLERGAYQRKGRKWVRLPLDWDTE